MADHRFLIDILADLTDERITFSKHFLERCTERPIDKDFVPGKPINRVGPVRDIGLEFSNGKYIIFLDTDIIVNPSFISEHLKSFKSALMRVTYKPDYLHICNI